jgi:hypothetical protein
MKNKYKLSKYIQFTTTGIIPGKPQRLIFLPVSSQSNQVNWGEPPDCNGEINGYFVEHHPENDQTQKKVLFIPGS